MNLNSFSVWLKLHKQVIDVMFSLGWKLNMMQWEAANIEPPSILLIYPASVSKPPTTVKVNSFLCYGISHKFLGFHSENNNKTRMPHTAINMLIKFAFRSKKNITAVTLECFLLLFFYLDHSEQQKQTLDYLKLIIIIAFLTHWTVNKNINRKEVFSTRIFI